MNAWLLNILFILFFKYISCQVCNETRSIFREVPETYRYSYIESYKEPCVIFCSVKTRTAVNVTTRIVQSYENVTVNVCCEGYIEDEEHEGNGIYCKPVCNPACHNGYCRRPNECACQAGYALDPLDPHICKPLCLEGCDIPDCITATPQCSINTGSTCSEPCVNATCMAPGICQCLPGYHKTPVNVCEPLCSTCEHGTCVAPDTCVCDPGWRRECGSCKPECSECEHGTCVSPEECECNPGYIKLGNKCEPNCSSECANGRCVSPGICRCNPGWYMMDEGGECFPHCGMSCENGDCIAPNVCQCHSGYGLDATKHGCFPICEHDGNRCSHETHKCSKMCIPNTDDGSSYHCFDNTTASMECPQIKCVFKNVTVNVSLEDNEIIQGNVTVTTPLQNRIDYEPSSTFIPTTEKGNLKESVLNLHKVFEGPKTAGISVYWICGIIALAVLIACIVLGIIIRKCKKDKNHDGIPDEYSL